VEERKELVHIDLVCLGNGAESLREGGEIARELRADTAIGKECALLQEFLVHLVGGSCAEAELRDESFRWRRQEPLNPSGAANGTRASS